VKAWGQGFSGPRERSAHTGLLGQPVSWACGKRKGEWKLSWSFRPKERKEGEVKGISFLFYFQSFSNSFVKWVLNPFLDLGQNQSTQKK